MKITSPRTLKAGSALAVLGLLATGCSAQSAADSSATTPTRVAVTYANGVSVLDGQSLEVLKSFDTEEFTRLNSAGDGKNFMLTTSKGFQVLDAVTPELTQTTFAASAAGHVVAHAGKTALFDDGSGTTTLFDTDELAGADGKLPEVQTVESPAHHGVSVALEDGSVLTTIGDADSRSGVQLLDGKHQKVAENTDCPGVHGEGTAAQGRAVFGCENGALVFADGKFTKLTAPDAYGRMGNAYVSPTSELVIGDYKDDPDAEGSLLHQITLIDTAKPSYQVVDLPEGVEYTWRGVARGPQDLGYLLGTDGKIHVIDPSTGKITRSLEAIDPWEGPAQWQEAHPSLRLDGNTAYVSEPAKKSLYAIDLDTGEKTATVKLDAEPNEMAVTTK
ncbi:zinc metallochaperone AztD [Glutamicibacter sp. JL.03c]|uniref:zinc metallochaperone AztD n=1 Tax=Glutamicibacter sp. JL.03c TaxID=2984842 RepID=UPI0021F7D544|nr:zinc metallochaperone AztD [Glutamicibacter sp. JL.03c]UYQ77013.1 zinc metallochaperone AztD [Glutamicibacter sp. JL.03c]